MFKQAIIQTNRNPEQNWHILYTQSRAEKAIYKELLQREIEAFLPTCKTLRVWKNRQKKWIDEVLFPNYMFARVSKHDLHTLIRIPKVIMYIEFNGKPATVPENDINGIKKMLNLGKDVAVDNTFEEGEHVRIIHGPLARHEGILIQQKGKTRFGIQLKQINQTVFVDVDVSMLEKIFSYT